MTKILGSSSLQLAIAGALATLSFEPFGLPIFLIPAFYILLKNVYLADRKKAFYNGFVFGFSHFITSLYWIAIALTSNIGNFLWLIPFAVLLIPALLGIYVGLACMLASLFRKQRCIFIIAFAAIWTITEVIRGSIPVPFPWNFMGYTISSSPYTLPFAQHLGLHLCSFFVVLLASIVFSKNLFISSCAYLLALLSAITLYIDQSYPIQYWDEKIRIVQPNLAEHHLGKPDAQVSTMLTLSELSTSLSSDGSDIKAVIWPEAAYPYLFGETFNEINSLVNLSPTDGYLIFGADRIDSAKHLYNSIVAIDTKADIKSIYDKNILVPFGEYVPFTSILPFVDKVAYGIYEFTEGSKYIVKTDNVALKYYPLVCYEVIFPIKQDLSEYEWLLNVTNDAWYGRSLGPYQHLAMAKFKAAEYGMPLIRVANTGVSAVISPYGTILEQLELNTQAIRDTRIPKKLPLENRLLRDNQNIFISIIFLICLCYNLQLRIKP